VETSRRSRGAESGEEKTLYTPSHAGLEESVHDEERVVGAEMNCLEWLYLPFELSACLRI